MTSEARKMIQQVAAKIGYDPTDAIELAACLLEEVNYHKEAATVRNFGSEEMTEEERREAQAEYDQLYLTLDPAGPWGRP